MVWTQIQHLVWEDTTEGHLSLRQQLLSQEVLAKPTREANKRSHSQKKKGVEANAMSRPLTT